ncbi:MAG: hypothetical protein ACRETT_11900, partial [Steroidobacteraceae bacterium]
MTAARGALTVLLALACSFAVAQEQTTGAQIEELKQAISVRDQVIRNLITRIEQLERAVSAIEGGSVAVAETPAPAAAEPGEPGEEGGRTGGAVPVREEDDQRLIRAAFERTLIERGGLLLPAWTFELEPSMSYAHSSSENLVIDGFTIFPVLIVGDVFSERRRRNTLTTTFTARLGLPWRSQLALRVPYVFEDESRLTGDGEELKRSDRGFGDVELALSRELPQFFGAGPSLLASLRWKMVTAEDPFGIDENDIPFGNGFHTLSASLTGVSVLDPVVLFGSLTYTEALSADKGGLRIDPGESLAVQLGMAVALNLETSVSFAFEQSFTGRTRVDGAEVPGTYVNTSTLSIGMSRAFPSGFAFDTNLAIGLSEDSPDLQLNFAAPLRRIGFGASP